MGKPLVFVLIILALCAGCADFKTYLKDRGNDLADCFTARVGICYGLGVRAQVTNYLTASVGASLEKKKLGYFGRKAVNTKGIWAGVPVVGLVVFFAGLGQWHNTPMAEEDFRRESIDTRKEAKSFVVFLLLLFTDVRSYEHNALPAAMSLFGVNVVELESEIRKICSRISPRTPRLREDFFVEIGATLGAVGFDLGFNPAEFVDFLLGWFGVDITGDDLKSKPPHDSDSAKSKEQHKKR